MTHFLFLSASEWLFLGTVATLSWAAWLLNRHKDGWLSKLPFMNHSLDVYTITYDDNFHNHDSSERYSVTVTGGRRRAIREAKRAINADLSGMTTDCWWISPNELYRLWRAFGETPYVSGFNPHRYALRRAYYYSLRKLFLRF